MEHEVAHGPLLRPMFDRLWRRNTVHTSPKLAKLPKLPYDKFGGLQGRTVLTLVWAL